MILQLITRLQYFLKRVFTFLSILGASFTQAQVGINTTTPSAQLDIRSSSQAAPSNTDGILIPKIDTFPASNPGADQNGMMVFLTTTIDSNIPGFYYWEATSNTWIPLKGKEGGTLDEAYDFGGPGAGNTIIADAGAITIAGTDGLVSTGVANSGAVMPSGAGVRMVWNPRKAAFRSGRITGTEWDDANIGFYSIGFGLDVSAPAIASTAFGFDTVASGSTSTAFGYQSSASENTSTSFGFQSIASGPTSTAFGYQTAASANSSTVFGRQNTASSFGETVIGIGATAYTPSANGDVQFRAANVTDRLFVIGNAVDTNNDNSVQDSERRDAMVVLKNGNVGFGTSNPARRLHVSNGNSGATSNANSAMVVESSGAVYQHFLTPSTSENGFLFGTDTGSIRGGIIYNNTNAQEGFQFRTGGNITQMTLTDVGNLGIGTATPEEKLHVSGPAGLTVVRIANTSGIGANSNVALDFFRRTNINTDWRIFNSGASLTLGNSFDDLATVNDRFQFQNSRFIPMTDGTLNLGDATFRWNTLFASNGVINTSDAREKQNIQNLNYGLNALMQLRPVSFEWKKQDGSGTKLGLIAQELQGVIPEVVRDWDWQEDELGNRRKVRTPLLGVYYSDLIPVLIKATQEQQQIIETQKEAINQLQEQHRLLLERIERLEQH